MSIEIQWLVFSQLAFLSFELLIRFKKSSQEVLNFREIYHSDLGEMVSLLFDLFIQETFIDLIYFINFPGWFESICYLVTNSKICSALFFMY